MVWKRNRAAATELLAGLPELPRPWRVEELCVRVAARRGRPLLLHEIDLPALPFGLWFDDGDRDHIIHRTGVTGFHRDHIILHELCHLLAGHNRGDGPQGPTPPLDRLVDRAIRNPNSGSQEDVAEMFASLVLRLANQRSPDEVSAFERRAAAMFGAA